MTAEIPPENSPTEANEITVYKLDVDGREVWRYPATVLTRTRDHVRLQAAFNRDDMDLGYTTFKRGDRFIEYFYSDRWYNIFVVYDRDDGALKGWYCNVCRPAQITETAVRCDDLALDVWVGPDGRTHVLDEDEFAALPLDETERRNGREALDKLLEMAQHSQLPR